jgi:hypothetical protein
LQGFDTRRAAVLKKTISALVFALACTVLARADERQDRQADGEKARPERAAEEKRAPLVINISHGSRVTQQSWV